MFKTFLERVFPAELQLNPRNTLFYTLLCKRFSIKNETTMASMDDYTLSNHETVGGQRSATSPFVRFRSTTAYLSRNARVQLRTKTGLFTVTGFSKCDTPTKTRPSCPL